MGNWRTASRYAQMLRASGINAAVFEPKDMADACAHTGQRTVAIVLNAARSHQEITTFARAGIPVMVVLTGTDLYGALAPDATGSERYGQAEKAMHTASLLLTLQEEAKNEVQQRWPKLADRVHSIIQTSPQRSPHAPRITPNSKTVRFLIAAHIREEKDPRTAFLAFHKAFPDGWAVRSEGRRVPVRLIHVGGRRDKSLAQELMQMGSNYPGILLEGSLSHAQTMRQMTHVHCLVQPSVSEGGALVVSEAVACRLPILASNIPSHRSQLGADYPGLFPVGSVSGLAELMTRFVGDQAFVDSLFAREAGLISKLATPSHEREALAALVRRLSEFLPKE